jgi:glutaredoxin
VISLTLYTTAGCHLCELAEDILSLAQANYDLSIKHTEIGDDDDLVGRYGIRIPVIKFPDGSELGWPFELSDIESKLIPL